MHLFAVSSCLQYFTLNFLYIYIYLMVLDLRLGLGDLSHMSEYYNSRRLFCHRRSLKVCWCSSLLNIVFVCIFTC